MTKLRKLRTIDDILLDGKIVMVRVDFNVAVGPDGKVDKYEDYRLEMALPTIQELMQKRCKVILLTHLGRPGEDDDSNLDLSPIKARLAELLNEDIRMLPSLSGQDVNSVVAGLEQGTVSLLPNVRTDQRETSRSERFAQELAEDAEIYVNEAFSVSHRDHASISLLPTLLPSCAGRRTVIEYEVLTGLSQNPKHPYVAIASGAKVGTKIGLLRKLLSDVDYLCVGGRIANAFLASLGYCSPAQCDPTDVEEARLLLQENKEKIILPVDVAINKEEIVDIEHISSAAQGVWDLGPKTIEKYIAFCSQAATIMWNGPLGKCEEEPYHKGTELFAKRLSTIPSFVVVGGGDTVNILEKLRLMDKFSHVSVGGGAMVAVIEGNKMPGLEPLMKEESAARYDSSQR